MPGSSATSGMLAIAAALLAGAAQSAPAGARVLRVAPSGDGDESAFASVNEALDWAHRNSFTSDRETLAVKLAPGRYPPFAIRPEHGRVAVTGSPGSVVTGGVEVPPSLFKPSGAQGAYVADLASLKIAADDYGAIVAGASCVHGCTTMLSPVSLSGAPLVLARWPNVNATTGRNVYINAGKSCGAGCLEVADTATTERIKGWGAEGGGWIHGYFEWDWADCYRSITSVNASSSAMTIEIKMTPASESPKPNARFYGLNLLSELDAPGEYFLELSGSTQKLHLIPPASAPGGPSTWASGPVVALKMAAVNITGTTGVSVSNVEVVDSRGQGVVAVNVRNAVVSNVIVSRHGQQGIYMSNATDSKIVGATVTDTGCAAIRAHGGDASTLTPGNLLVENNHVSRFAMWKRTYEAGIHWNGVSNTYANNVVTDGPHNCFLGGGNEADFNYSLAGVSCVFDSNTLDECAYEAADTGAFYTCGQQGSASVNMNNTIVNSVFKNIRNTAGTGVQGPSVQAIYLDDQMSHWTIINNTFVNCQTGSFIGGGRKTTVKENYYEACDTAQHFDNRGMNWQKASSTCTTLCEPLSGCTCNRGAASWMRTKSAAAALWSSTVYPDAMFEADGVDLGVPRDNVIEGNTYCKCGKFIDASSSETKSWGSVVQNNVEKCRT